MNIEIFSRIKNISMFFQDLATANFLEGPLAPMDSNGINNATASKTDTKPTTLPKKDDKAAWFKLFAELDPLANPDNLLGCNTNQSHAA